MFQTDRSLSKKIKDTTKSNYFEANWKNKVINEDISRLKLYKTLNSDFTPPKHLGLPYKLRKVISQVRCSNHPLAIEKGRHKNPIIPREERICTLCSNRAVENEEHFLLHCPTYAILRESHHMNFENVPDMMNMDDQHALSKYLLSAFEFRQRLTWGRRRD